MSISCGCKYDEDNSWFYEPPEDFSVLNSKRSRSCCSCGCKVRPGEEAVEFKRSRHQVSEVEERIWGSNYVPLASWFMCEGCGGLFMALKETGYCITLRKGQSMKGLVALVNGLNRG